ncbi:NucA/NucB deoxyribonuclease domain-containing protein [Kitasatospora sp. NPDC093679]|uniref:NucA/NucB deoxyribonuclease domain-containing protein n=1 Tax=Kitasatospora sp. NPDC093679 TaxID=3154983 RepID=UPI003428A725
MPFLPLSPGRRRFLARAVPLAAATLLALTCAVPAGAAGTPSPPGFGGDPTATYTLFSDTPMELTPPGQEVPLEELLARARTTAAPAPHTAAAEAADGGRRAGKDDLAAYECREQESAFSGEGYGKSRFTTCQAYNLSVAKIECWLIFCRIAGTADVDIADVQRTRNAARQIDVVQVLDNWRLKGDIADTLLSTDVTCTARQGFGPCQVRDGWAGPVVQSIGAWAGEGSVTSRYYSFTLPAAGGLGQALISYADLNWHFAIPAGVPGADRHDGPNSGVRCDSAPYIINTNAGEGCVFPWVTETVQISAADYPESAAHILTAQYHPDQTLPPVAGKQIPGAPGSGRPLHRIADQGVIDAHRATAVAACNQWFPNYADEGLDCDEYPFASTQEGSDPATGNYSVEPIPDWDNRGSGAVVGNFYTYRRILGSDLTNDPFYVEVTP